MKFFFLGHGIMSYICLRNLIERDYKPEFVVLHKDLDYNTLKESFYYHMEILCKENNIQLYRINKLEELKEKFSSAEIGLCLGFMEIVKKEILDIPPRGIMNIHCGKLPEYRGRAPISRSIMNGESAVTISLHKMDEGVDSGDVCLELEVPVNDTDDVNSIYKKCSEKTPELVEEFFNNIDELECRKQNLAEYPKANRIISDEERKINWDKTSNEIYNLVRALVPPYPCAYFDYNGNKYLVTKAMKSDNTGGNPGEVINISENSLLVNSGDSSIDITAIADENLNPVHIIDTFHKGDILE